MSRPAPSIKAASFSESMIREMTRLADRFGAINLGQGFPDFPAPDAVKDAAIAAVEADDNQYPVTWGSPAFRAAIAASYERHYGLTVDPDTEVCVTCGSTEAMTATFLGLLDPGDEVVLFEPFYESYGPDSILSGARPRLVRLRPPDWTFDEADLAAAFNDRTRAIVINTPNNPTGKVFARDELEAIASLCQRYDAVAVTDEIYEHITYDGVRHVPIATLDGMRDRTVTISALSKTYAVTGWRVGWAVAPPALMAGIRPVHDFLTVAAPAPLQAAGVVALGLADDYLSELAEGYRRRRDVMLRILDEAGLAAAPPRGAYYVMADVSPFGFADATEAAQHLVREVGVGAVPGASFFADPSDAAHLLRFAFCKRLETLEEAGGRLRAFAATRA